VAARHSACFVLGVGACRPRGSRRAAARLEKGVLGPGRWSLEGAGSVLYVCAYALLFLGQPRGFEGQHGPDGGWALAANPAPVCAQRVQLFDGRRDCRSATRARWAVPGVRRRDQRLRHIVPVVDAAAVVTIRTGQ